MTGSKPSSSIESLPTLAHLFLARIDQSGGDTAIVFHRNGELVSQTWDKLANDVFCAVQGLRQLGVTAGDRVAHLSENRYEWIVADLAMQLAHAIHVPIHAPLAAEQVAYQVTHSGANAILVSTFEQAEKLQQSATKMPTRLAIVTFDEDAYEPAAAVGGGRRVVRFSDWIDEPHASINRDEGRAIAAQTRDQLSGPSLATILYTSGTTGQPKGVVLTQANLLSNAVATVKAFGMTGVDVRLNFLPLSHIFARTCDLYTWLVTGCQLCLATSRETVVGDCQWAKPTLISGVPYFFDRLRRYLTEQRLDQQPGALRHLLGGEIKYCCSGGAALPDHVFDFYESQGVTILQGYGLTETSPVISVSSPTAYRRGTSGRPLEHVDVRIAEDGEILTRGPHIMLGYWNDDPATRRAIVDGWFHTGDLGKVDEDGYVWITGRKKELIVTAAGKNVAPVVLESLLLEDQLFDQALIIGDARSYLTALIVPNWTELQRLFPNYATNVDAKDADTRRAACGTLAAVPEVKELVQSRIDQCLSCVSYHEQVRKFTLLPDPFSIERHEMTPKLSLRRPIIQENYASLIEAMYRK